MYESRSEDKKIIDKMTERDNESLNVTVSMTDSVNAPFMVIEDEVKDSCDNCRLLKNGEMVCGIYKNVKNMFHNAGQSKEPSEFYCSEWKDK